MARRRTIRLFSYRQPAAAQRTLKVLRAAYPSNVFALETRPDWRLYIRATRPDGQSGFVAKAPLRAIKGG